MKCSLNTLKNLRTIMSDTSEEAKASLGSVTAEGESFELTYKVFERYAKNIRNVGDTIAEFNRRVESLSKPFHKALRRELGEELQLSVDGKPEKFYLLRTQLEESSSSPIGLRVRLILARPDNLGAPITAYSNIINDSFVDGEGALIGEMAGVSPYVMKAVAAARKEEASLPPAARVIDDEGDPELKETLELMQRGDAILGSRGVRTSNSLKGYEKLTDFKHGDIESMRKLLVKLSVLGGDKAKDSVMEYYNALLDKMHPRFFNHLDMYLKRNSKETEGHINLDKDQMVFDVKETTGNAFAMSASEVYMHEVIHSMTAWALRQKAKSVGAARIGLNKAMEVALQHITWQDFLILPEADSSERDIEAAKAKMKYIFESKYGAEEFLAYTLTNPRLMELTKNIKMKDDKSVKEPTTVFRKVLRTFMRLVDNVLGNLKLVDNDATVFDQVNKLAFSLAEVNNRSNHTLDSMNPVGQMMEALEDSEAYLAEKLTGLKDKLSGDGVIKPPGDDASRYQTAKFLLKAIVKGITDPVHRKFFGLWLSALHISPGGTIREFTSSLFDRDEFFRVVESLKLRMDSLDAGRNSVINEISRSIIEGFKTPPTEAEEIAITRVLLDTNLTQLRYKRNGRRKVSNKEFRELLTDPEAALKRERRLKHLIEKQSAKEEKRKGWEKWTIAQAYSLGYFMATGKGNAATSTNSSNIVLGHGTNEKFTRDKKLEGYISELAAISSIKHLDKNQKKLVVRLLAEEGKALDVITDRFEGYKKQSAETLFRSTQSHMIEGHTKELFDDTVDIKIAPLEDRKKLESEGFKFNYQVPKAEGVTQKTPMAVYTTSSWGKAERLRGAIALGKNHTRGMTLSNIKRMEDPVLGDALFQKDFGNVYMKSLEIHNAMKDGTFDVSKVDNSMMPVYTPQGKPVDFRYMMTRENKEKVMRQDLRVSQVLSRSIAAIQYQTKTEKMNSETLKAIQADMATNWEAGEIGKDSATEYALIGPSATDPKMRELYRMLPKEYQKFILSRVDKTMAVRKDLLQILTGGTHLRTTDLVGVNRLPGVVKSVINTVEGVWMELVKISKGAILMKMPFVLVWNIVSNVIFQISQGAVDIPQLGKDYAESTREVNEYVKSSRKLIKLQEEITADKAALARVVDAKKLQNVIGGKITELNRIKAAMKNNPAHKLFEAGMYQSHIEDLHNSALSESNRITKAIGSRLDKLPKPVKATAEIAYLTQNTEWYKLSQEVLQRSDMISRLVEYKTKHRVHQKMVDGSRRLPGWWLEHKKAEIKKNRGVLEKGPVEYDSRQALTGEDRKEFFVMAEKVLMRDLLDNYVNYSLPNSNLEEYLNRLGVLMFTKYFKRIQSVVLNSGTSNPIKTSLLVVAATAGLQVEMIQDQAIIGKVFGEDGSFSFSNLVHVYSPFYHLENVFMPALIKDEALGGLFQ